MNAPFKASNVPHTVLLTVDDFLLLCKSGAFDGYAKSELIEGEIICMNAQHSRHARVKSLLVLDLGTLLRAKGSPLEAWSEVSVRLSANSLPEPDIVLTSYRGKDVVPLETVALLVEVADSTLDTDLGRKANLYASAHIPEYWVVDVEGEVIHQHWVPGPSGYAEKQVVAFGDTLSSMTLDDLSINSAPYKYG